jgi:hypothetical protein
MKGCDKEATVYVGLLICIAGCAVPSKMILGLHVCGDCKPKVKVEELVTDELKVRVQGAMAKHYIMWSRTKLYWIPVNSAEAQTYRRLSQ